MIIYPWRIELLGGLCVRNNHYQVSRFRTRSASTLLAFLALHDEQSHSREELTERFWPEALSQEKTRHNFRQTLFNLRRPLNSPQTAADTLITATNDMVALIPGAYTTDVAELENLVRAAAQMPNTLQQIALLKEVASLYRGELLPGHYEDWVLHKRYFLSEMHLQTLKTLTQNIGEQGDLKQAIRYALQVVVSDPADETGHETLKKLLRANDPSLSANAVQTKLLRLLAVVENGSSKRVEQHVGILMRDLHLPQSPESSASNLTYLPVKTNYANDEFQSAIAALPISLTRLVGRTNELNHLSTLLSLSGTTVRCVTLLGPGGIGKTRLAVEVARPLSSEYSVVFVPLAAVSDAQRLPFILAKALGLPPSSSSIVDDVVLHLQHTPCLMVLDNLEHLAMDAVPLIELLLQRAPTLRCLTTSRRRLRVGGEHCHEVGPLSVPDPAIKSNISDSESAELFLECARTIRYDFAITPRNAVSVNALCTALEGVPLAIELAASRIGTFSLAEMVTHINNRLRLLEAERAGLEPRHRSLRVVLSWSFSLLPSEVRHFLLRLSVFQGGWTVATAEAVCQEPQARNFLEHLRLHSLVTVKGHEEGASLQLRFQMLETVREFGQEQLSPQEGEETSRAHADFFLLFCTTPCDRCGNCLNHDQIQVFGQFDFEYNNLVAAMDWYCGAGSSPHKALRITLSLSDYWFVRGLYSEQRRWLERLLKREESMRAAAGHFAADVAWDVAIAHYILGRAALTQADWETADEHMRIALKQFQSLDKASWVGRTLNKLAVLAQTRGDYQEASLLFEQSRDIFQAKGDRDGVAHELKCLGCLKIEQGEYDGVHELFEISLDLYRAVGNLTAVCMMLSELGRLALLEGRFMDAQTLLTEALEMSRQTDARYHIANSLYLLGSVSQRRGESNQAVSFFEEAKECFHRMGMRSKVEEVEAALTRL